jgi:carboxyl-terminal processing protease
MSKKIFQYVFMILMLIGAFFLGSAYAGSQQYLFDLSSSLNFWQGDNKVLVEVYDMVKGEFLGEIDNRKLYYGMVRGMVKSLDDPYSEFFDPEEAQVFWDDLGGEFEGIGVEIVLEEGKAKILTVLSDSPAEKSGLKVNDVILAVDKNDVIDKSLGEIASMIKGPAGSTVELMVLRGDTLENIIVERQKLVADSVYSVIDGDIVNIRITRFDEDTAEEFDNKVKAIDLNGKKGMIIDLRGNPGGYFDSAVKLVDEFLADGLIVTESNDQQMNEEYQAKPGEKLENIKIVVLIDQASASAAEIFAGAIKDNGRGKIVGMESYGKGSVQVVERLSDGSALKLTIAEWLTPAGINLRKEGIKPDLEVQLDESEVDIQYNKAKELLLSE